MTAQEIFESEHYYDPYFTFKGEKWSSLKVPNFNKYQQSNCFRIRNARSLKILKPRNISSANRFDIRLYDDNGFFRYFNMNTLFDDFDIVVNYKAARSKEFIFDAF